MRRLSALAIVAVLVVAALFAFDVIGNTHEVHASALFSSSKGLYVGDDVRVLGVQVGRIDSIEPEGDHVRVSFSVPGSVKLPENAGAVIISPSIVASRYVQISPAYTAGPTMADGDVIPLNRTAVPQEFDDTKTELVRLSKALGPLTNGESGSLNRVIEAVGHALGHGNAQRLNETLASLANASDAVANGRGDLFATVKSLNSFLSNLVQNDASLRRFSSRLQSVSATLVGDRSELALALDTLGAAFRQMNAFIRTAEHPLTSGVRKLATLSSAIAESTGTLESVLHSTPNAVANLYNIMDPRYDAFTGFLASQATSGTSIPQLICGAAAGILDINPQTSGRRLDEFGDTCRSGLSPFASVLQGLGSGLNTSLPFGLSGESTGPKTSQPNGTAPPASSSPSSAPPMQSLLSLLLPGVAQ